MMDLTKRSPGKVSWFKLNRPPLIAMSAFCLLSGIALAAWWSKGAHQKSAAQIEQENKQFMTYLVEHSCTRYDIGFSITYYCDSGAWSESELVQVVNGRYPN